MSLCHKHSRKRTSMWAYNCISPILRFVLVLSVIPRTTDYCIESLADNISNEMGSETTTISLIPLLSISDITKWLPQETDYSSSTRMRKKEQRKEKRFTHVTRQVEKEVYTKDLKMIKERNGEDHT